SSKAFRVFNKRTKKVEENLHVDFLENKLIEKGAGPNWLFDTDTLTNSKNYVPIVVAGTSSTNISAHMETSNDTIRNSDTQDDSQKEQDCNVDVPESSSISNPTATLKVPSADQVEPSVSLTVEYDILIVGSPVPTVCLDIFPDSSSGPRLISKEDFSHKETPSLGNALTLSNKFEDTFEVEADLSNMEISILVSPTPTFRIHKDHLKSQIIGSVDTPEEPNKIFNALKDPSWVEAMQEELLQFKIQNRDAKSAFLYGTIDEEVYMMQHHGFQDPEFLDIVYKVEEAMGTIDQTLSIRKHKGEILLVQVYVDDIIFRSSNPQLCREFEALMHDKFQMSAMGELTFFLDVRSANTPMDKDNPWGKDGPSKDVELHLYRSMIGSLMYLTASRPDIMFAVCACARHQVTPKECHLHAVKRIFRYLKGHPKLGLWYPKEPPFDLVAYSDRDYGGATQDRKSTSKGCQFLRRRLISWQ
nr:hypothetical protein [Tanacetum cinerariifolium]